MRVIISMFGADVETLLPVDAAVCMLATDWHIATPSDTAGAYIKGHLDVEGQVEEGSSCGEEGRLRLGRHGGAYEEKETPCRGCCVYVLDGTLNNQKKQNRDKERREIDDRELLGHI